MARGLMSGADLARSRSAGSGPGRRPTPRRRAPHPGPRPRDIIAQSSDAGRPRSPMPQRPGAVKEAGRLPPRRERREAMRGVVFLGDRKLEVREVPDPTPGPRDVILEIKASGMCGSDLHNYRAPAQPAGTVTGGIRRQAGMIAGHEPCGIVAAVGTGVIEKEARIGQRVMDHHYEGCGNCKHCRAGWTQMCLEGTVVYGSGGHGGHARYMKVPVSTLVPLPDALSFVTGAAISCGTGTAWGALKRLNLQGGETIAIFGQGPVGLSATQLAVVMGARVIAVDIAPERRKLAQVFGAHEVIDPGAGDVVAAIRGLTHGEGAHKT